MRTTAGSQYTAALLSGTRKVWATSRSVTTARAKFGASDTGAHSVAVEASHPCPIGRFSEPAEDCRWICFAIAI